MLNLFSIYCILTSVVVKDCVAKKKFYLGTKVPIYDNDYIVLLSI